MAILLTLVKVLLVIISLIGLLVCVVLLIFSAIKKDGKYRRSAVGILICSAGFIISISFPNPDTSSSSSASIPVKTPDQIAQENLQTKQEDEARVVALAAKKKTDADADAEAKAKEPISTDFVKFDIPYDNMTSLQKDAYWKTVESKYVQWTGEVVEVSENSIQVRVKRSTLTSDFLARINEDQHALLPKINLGQKITIRGRLSSEEGVILPWGLDNGQIIQ